MSKEVSPTISVIICSSNRAESLRNVLDSLTEQKASGDLYEIIVVDNNSTDSTKPVVESYINKIRANLRYCFEARQGKSYALNTGIRCAKGTILAFGDDDVILGPDWIANILKNFKKNGSISGLAGRVIPRVLGDLPNWLKLDGALILKGPLNYYDHGSEPFLLQPGRMPFLGANMALKKEVFERNGYFNEEIKQVAGKYVVGEDSEYYHYITKRGEKIMYAPDVVVEHIFDATRLNKNYLKKWYFFIGTSTVILNGRDQNRIFLGIPLWLIKDTLVSFLRSLKTCWKRGSAEAFFLITRFYFNLGKIRGYLLYERYAIGRLEALRNA